MRINGVQPASGIKRLELEIGDRVQYTIGDMDPNHKLEQILVLGVKKILEIVWIQIENVLMTIFH